MVGEEQGGGKARLADPKGLLWKRQGKPGTSRDARQEAAEVTQV